MKADELSKIGVDLVADSKALQRTPGKILQELFPYVLEASRRMSAREISRWLEEKHGVQISQPTISRALRNASGGWEGFDEIILPVARRVSSSLGISMKELLLDDSNESSYELHCAREAAENKLTEAEFKEVEEGLEFLRENWFSLSAGTRRACVPSNVLAESEEEEGGI
jgi:hypothetical protein